MSLLTGWPAYSDDSGNGTSGTVVNAAFLDTMKTAIEALIHSVANPTISPAAAIDEVKQARGSLGSLDARLDVFLNEDGTPKGSAAFPTAAEVKSGLANVNLLANEDFNIWPAGDSASPAYWAIGTSTPTRVGNGLGDTTRKHGKFALKITGSISPPQAVQVILDAVAFPFTALKGRKVAFGIRVKTLNTGVRASVYDGVTRTTSAAHTGGGSGGPDADGWEWLTVVHTVSASATSLQVEVIGNAISDVVYISGGTAIISDIAPTDWVPSPRSVHTAQFFILGNQAAGTDKGNLTFHRPAIVLDVRLHATTAPTTQALIVDVNHWDGSAYQSMFSTRPQLAATVKDGFAQPDSTYRYRCFAGMEAGGLTNAQLSWDIDQVGTGTVGADLSVMVRFMQYDRPFEGVLAFDD